MKILMITAEGLPLFPEKLIIPLYATQRVTENDSQKLHQIFSNLYLNCAEAFVGINASGKTSILNVIVFAIELLKSSPINHIESKLILGNSKNTVITIYFTSNKSELCKLETQIYSDYDNVGNTIYKIKEEKLWIKKEKINITKTQLFNFSENEPVITRTAMHDKINFLSDDVSIIISYLKETKEEIHLTQMLFLTNINYIPYDFKEIPKEIIEFLDPSIEYIILGNSKDLNTSTIIKFKGMNEIVIEKKSDLINYLSSGTIKGISVFIAALITIKNGGYLVIDEIENHFNKEIVSTLLRFFTNKKTNPNGAVLIYSTHYPELLDEHDRNDSIFITFKENGIKVKQLSTILKRNDIKKSEVYQSGYLGATTPSYNSYIELKKLLLRN